ncbi:MAG: hypothetical protein KKA73_10375 [Chloroflexi bacterium]|nr:hypothetical protein [Chloroflexota bacterium]MBU1748083.1 hypothetical protein [Chloroflexota bacterium]
MGIASLMRREDGISMIWWAIVIAAVIAPLMMLSMEVARYYHARGEIQKGADLAALAATQEVDIPYLQRTGQVRLTGLAPVVAQQYLSRNTNYLTRHGIHARVTSVRVVPGRIPQVLVTAEADLTPLFPSGLSNVIVHMDGVAEVRAF